VTKETAYYGNIGAGRTARGRRLQRRDGESTLLNILLISRDGHNIYNKKNYSTLPNSSPDQPRPQT
jgi:hypothetical protein